MKLHFSPNTVRILTSRMRWAGHVKCMGQEKCTQILGGKYKDNRQLCDSGTDWRIFYLLTNGLFNNAFRSSNDWITSE